MGAGTGFAEGARSLNNSVLTGIQLGMQQDRYNKLDERYQKAMDYNLEWQRGLDGLPPSYTDEEEAQQAAATRPEIPSSVPTSTPGPLGVPQTTFPVGKPVQPMPADTPRAAGGAIGLIPPGMRPPRVQAPIGRTSTSLGMGRLSRPR